jgi:hypothetical protein
LAIPLLPAEVAEVRRAFHPSLLVHEGMDFVSFARPVIVCKRLGNFGLEVNLGSEGAA